jgi:hypothetical protein
VVTDPSKSRESKAKPKAAEPKPAIPTDDEKPVDDKTPIVRHG